MANIRRLTSSFGSFATPDDPFMSGKIAIIFDGVWRYNFIQQFAPGLNYGVAGWPEAQPGIDDFTIADADMLVIPRGAKHPREAWEFLKYVSSPNLNAQTVDELTGVELVCYYQKKASPWRSGAHFLPRTIRIRTLIFFGNWRRARMRSANLRWESGTNISVT